MISTPETAGLLDSTRAMQVWVQMAEIFGKAFYREHSSEPSNLWIRAIARLHDSEIVRGLENMANDGLEFPANLSQFVAACKRITPARGIKYLPMSDTERKSNADKSWADMERLAGRKLR